jgi:anthranilate synthase/aminodeoxychorismate synthase-like glutamine amidotransferase
MTVMVFVIDNYDSFTYNLVQYLGQCGADVTVKRNDEITWPEIKALKPDGIMLSPGPCTPEDAGVCLDVIDAYLQSRTRDRFPPLFGVCLGHQAMGLVGGGIVERAAKIMHGKASLIRHDGKGVFEGVANPFSAIRYHSLVIRKTAVPKGFYITATSEDDGEIMGMRHESLPIESVQFHPESVLTDGGFQIVANFVKEVNRHHSQYASV